MSSPFRDSPSRLRPFKDDSARGEPPERAGKFCESITSYRLFAHGTADRQNNLCLEEMLAQLLVCVGRVKGRVGATSQPADEPSDASNKPVRTSRTLRARFAHASRTSVPADPI